MQKNMRAFIEARLQESEFISSLPESKVFDGVSAQEIRQKIPPFHHNLTAALQRAKEAFCVSEVAKLLESSALEMTPKEIMQQLPRIISIPEIQTLSRIARGPDVFAVDSLNGTIIKELIADYAPSSMLIQFCATSDIVVVSGTIDIGFALNFVNLTNASLYVGVSVGIGPGVIVAAGQGVGLTSNSYSDVTGACVGVDAAGDYVFGGLVDFSVKVSAPYIPVVTHIAPKYWTLVGYFIEGMGLGVAAYGGFTLKVLDETLPNIYQAPAACRVDISSIDCIKQQDTSGHDEIYFSVAIDNDPAQVFRYPLWDHYSITEGGTWDIGFTVNFNSSFNITLYESGDVINTWTVTASGGSYPIAAPGNDRMLPYDNGKGGPFHNHVEYHIYVYTHQST